MANFIRDLRSKNKGRVSMTKTTRDENGHDITEHFNDRQDVKINATPANVQVVVNNAGSKEK